MYTVKELPNFQKQAARIWSQAELHAFIDWISENPLAGDVVPNAGGARKVRWAGSGKGKRGGARVIYFNMTETEGLILLIACYAKSDRANMTAKDIQKEL